MKQRLLGRTGISVSEICLGTMTWGTQNTEADAHAQMDYAVENGVNFFDTAELYPTTPVSAETQGRTEDYIGTWFEKTGKRDQVVLAARLPAPVATIFAAAATSTPQPFARRWIQASSA